VCMCRSGGRFEPAVPRGSKVRSALTTNWNIATTHVLHTQNSPPEGKLVVVCGPIDRLGDRID
jgi:hypothetical protein